MLSKLVLESSAFILSHDRCPSGTIMSNYHFHLTGELVIVDEGRSTVICDGRVVSIEAPYAAYYPPGCYHQQLNDTERAYSRYLIRCADSYIHSISPSVVRPERFTLIKLDGESGERFLTYVRLLEDVVEVQWDDEDSSAPPPEYQPISELADRRRRHLLALIYNEFNSLIPPDSVLPATKGAGYIHDVCLYIYEHRSEELSIDLLAQKFYISRATLIRKFRSATGMTIGEYIKLVRIVEARHLLAGRKPIADIARLCGFSRQDHFTKVFSKYVGVTPAKYRENCKKLKNNHTLE